MHNTRLSEKAVDSHGALVNKALSIDEKPSLDRQRNLLLLLGYSCICCILTLHANSILTPRSSTIKILQSVPTTFFYYGSLITPNVSSFNEHVELFFDFCHISVDPSDGISLMVSDVCHPKKTHISLCPVFKSFT